MCYVLGTTTYQDLRAQQCGVDVAKLGPACDYSLLHSLRFGAAGHKGKNREDSVFGWGTSLNRLLKLKGGCR